MTEHEAAQTEGRASVDPVRWNHMQMVNAVVLHGAFGGDLSQDHAIQVFKAHNDEVRRTVPPDRLLVYEAGQGWAPLCAFVGVPEPAIPYPKVNSAADFATRFPDK